MARFPSKMQSNIQMQHPLRLQLAKMQRLNDVIQAQIAKKKEGLSFEMMRRVQGGEPRGAPADELRAQFKASLPAWMRPGNVGQINDIFWAFLFTFDDNNQNLVTIPPNGQRSVILTITAEAGFTWIDMIKAIYLKDDQTDALTYVNPDDETAAGKTPGLKWSIRDANSSRVFTNGFVDADHVALPRFPTTHPKPQYFMPNANIELTWANEHPTNTYVAYMTLKGYRIRQPDYLLSLVD